MKLPRDVSGHDLVTVLCRDWQYVKVNQVGDHIVLQTQSPFRIALRSLLIGRFAWAP